MEVVVQGFRPGPGEEPYVFVGIAEEDGTLGGFGLSTENANILGEYLRQEAEFAQTVREEGDK